MEGAGEGAGCAGAVAGTAGAGGSSGASRKFVSGYVGALSAGPLGGELASGVESGVVDVAGVTEPGGSGRVAVRVSFCQGNSGAVPAGGVVLDGGGITGACKSAVEAVECAGEAGEGVVSCGRDGVSTSRGAVLASSVDLV